MTLKGQTSTITSIAFNPNM